METKKPLNRRKCDRYIIDEIPVEGIGSVVEVSRKGLKIRKATGFTNKIPALNFNIATVEIKTEVRWENNDFIGLQFSGAFNDPAFIVKRIKKPKEVLAPPQMSIPEKAIQQYKKDEILTKMVNLILEMDSHEPNMKKIGAYIDDISSLEELKRRTDMEALKAKDGEPDGGTAREKEESLPLLKDMMIAKAVSSDAGIKIQKVSIDFAINRLGHTKVREILRIYGHKRFFQSKNAVSMFEDYEAYSILKSAVFRKLCRFFGFFDIQPEGDALLSSETVGVELLIRESSGILDKYYKSPFRLYSEVSLSYERALFGADQIQIGKYHFEKVLGAFEELYNGYVLAHNTLNPHYSLPKDIRIKLTKNGLVFSYIAYLTFRTVVFVMDRDAESGFSLSKRLKGKGMDDKKIAEFLDESVNEAKIISNNLAVKEHLARPSLPSSSFDPIYYFGRDIRFGYLLQAFRDFNIMNLKRMALRYEDASYAHFILGKIIDSEGFGLNSKTFIVISCSNLSDDQWYLKDFAYFDLIIFKDILKLPAIHMNAFIKLWSDFESKIIVTYSKFDFMDYSDQQLYSAFNNCIVDFPSYFLNDLVYKKMIEHSVNYLKPYIGRQQVDISKYLNEIYTMAHVKTDILLSKEIT